MSMPFEPVSGSARPSSARPSKEVYNNPKLRAALKGIYKVSRPEPEILDGNKRGLSLVSDQNSAVNQLCISLNSSKPPAGMITEYVQTNLNSWTRSLVVFGDWIEQFIPYVRSLSKDFKGTFWSTRTVNISYLTAYLGSNICSAITVAGNVASNFAANLAPATKTALKTVGKVGGIFFIIYGVFRSYLRIQDVRKTAHVQRLLGRAKTVSDKLDEIRKLWQVEDAEVLAQVPKGMNETVYFEKFLEDNVKAKYETHLKQLGDQMIQFKAKAFRIGEVITTLDDPDFKAFVAKKMHIDPKVASTLSGAAVLGMGLAKAVKAEEKQNDFLSRVTENKTDGEKIRTMVETTLKMQRVTGAVLAPGSTEDKAAQLLIAKLTASMNRKQITNVLLILCCVMTMAGSIVSLTCPPLLAAAVASVISIWIITNVIGYFISLREIQEVATNDRAFQKDRKRMLISLAVSIIGIALMAALMCTPVGHALAMGVVVASFLSLALYFVINLALLTQSGRRMLGSIAEKVDVYFHQKITAFVGLPIEVQESVEKMKALKEISRGEHLKGKLLKMSLEEKLGLLNKVFNRSIESLNLHRNRQGYLTAISKEALKAYLETSEGEKQLDRALATLIDQAKRDEGKFERLKRHYQVIREERARDPLPMVFLHGTA